MLCAHRQHARRRSIWCTTCALRTPRTRRGVQAKPRAVAVDALLPQMPYCLRCTPQMLYDLRCAVASDLLQPKIFFSLRCHMASHVVKAKMYRSLNDIPCVRQPLSEALMQREASVQHCKQTSDRHLLFSPGFLKKVVQVQDDLCSAAIIPLWTAMMRIIDIFVFNRVATHELGLLPKQDTTHAKKDRVVSFRQFDFDEAEPLV
ncbi:MAG: hypothetical protein SGPRY_001265 [Prymnesium sp.]